MIHAGIREAVAVFSNQRSLDAAIAELEATAFPRHDISVMGGRHALEKRFGVDTINPMMIEDDPNAPSTVSIRPEDKTIAGAFLASGCAYAGGCLAAIMAKSLSYGALVFAITGGSVIGGAIGLLAVFLIRKKMIKNTKEQIAKGGLVLWVHTTGQESEEMARSILQKHGGRDVHIHEV